MLLQLQYESKYFPVMERVTFDEDPYKWQDLQMRFTDDNSFTDEIRMERLLSVLDWGAKLTVISIGRNSLFYAAAKKAINGNFGNPMILSFLKLKSVIDIPGLRFKVEEHSINN